MKTLLNIVILFLTLTLTKISLAQTNSEFSTMHAGVGYQSTTLSLNDLFNNEELPDSITLRTVILKVKEKGYKAAGGVSSFSKRYNYVVIQSENTALMCRYINEVMTDLEREVITLRLDDKISTKDKKIAIEVFKELK